MADEKYYVYKHTSPNGKVYIGITCQNPSYRWKSNGDGYKGQSLFFNAIQKYGWDNIRHEILFTGLTKEEACQKEIELIAEYKSNKREYGYNISSGGDGVRDCSSWAKGKTFTEEHKKRMSEAQKGEKGNMWGKHPSERTIEKIKKNSPKNKAVCQYSLDNKLLNTYFSSREAERKTKIPHTNINNCCKKKRMFHTAGGFIWRYAE